MVFRTHNGLTEVFAHGRVSKGGEVDAVEVLLVPEVHLRQTGVKKYPLVSFFLHWVIPHFNDSTYLVELFHVESFVGEWCNVKITPENYAVLKLLNC